MLIKNKFILFLIFLFGFNFELFSQTIIFSDDFDPSPESGWTHGAISGSDSWATDEPQGGRGDSGGGSADPNTDYTSSNTDNNVYGQGLNSGSGDGVGGYYDNSNEYLQTPSIDCSNFTSVILKFYRWANFENNYDEAYVEVSTDGSSWTDLGEPQYPQDNSWTYVEIDISSIADGESTVYVRWRSNSDGSVTYSGWNLDDVTVEGVSSCSATEYVWTGSINTEWGTAGNWCSNAIPTSSTNVTIPGSGITNWPVLNVDGECNNITIESGAQLSGSSNNLNVYGNWTNNGIFNSGTGTVYFKGSNNASLTVTGSSQTILSEGFESGAAGWTLGSQSNHTEWRRQTGASHNGSYDCASYDLDGNNDHDYYHGGTNIYVDLSRNIDLSDYSSASITYYWRCNSSSGTVNNIFSFDGTVLKDDMEGSGSSWHSATFGLDSYCGDYDNFMFFRMWAGSGVSGTPGLCIDDITITGTPNVEHFNNLVIQKSGAAKLTLASSIKTKTNLQISSGEFDADGYNITVAGNFTNNGTFSSGTGIAKFDGLITQTISGSSNTSFYKFIKNTSSDLVFSGNSTTITVLNSFIWIDNDDKININGTNLNVIINDKVLVNMGCELDVSNGSTISIAKNFQNLGTIDFTSSTSVLKFHSNNNSYVLTEPGDTIFYDGFETDPFTGSTWTIDQGGTDGSHRSDWRWSNGQQHAGTHDFAVMDNSGPTPYDYQWNSPADYCETEISVDLTNYSGAILEFWWKCGGDDPAQASYAGDYGQVFVNGTAITEKLWGQQNYKKHLPISLADYAGQIITITFRFDQDGKYSGGHATSPGLCIDDILIYANCIQTLNVHDLLVSKNNNSTSTVVLCPIDANDDVTVTQGILDASGNNIWLEGNWSNAAGTKFLARQDTVTFDGSSNKTVDIGSTSFDNIFVNKSSAKLTIANNTLDVDRTLKIFSNSTLDASGIDIELGKDWINEGVFSHGNNTVIFDGISILNTGGTGSGKRFFNVVLNGTSALLQDHIRTDNDFHIINGNWDVSSSNKRMIVFGDFICDDTFTERNAKVTLRGNSSIVNFSSDPNFYKLTINKSDITQYVECVSGFSVKNNLTMSVGQIDLRDQTIDLDTTGNLVNETNDSRIFASDGSGSPGGGTGTITATRTNPSGNIAGLGCEITPSSAMGVTTIARGHLLYSNVDGAGHGSITRYFDISPANNSGLNATFKFHYFENELQGQPEADLEQWRSTDAGSTWTNRNGTVDVSNDFVTLAGIDAFSRWTLSGKEIPLPIQLLDFSASCDNETVEIVWKTALEKNNDYFTIEKSSDGVQFEDVGFVEGKGNSNDIELYSYVDFIQHGGTIYYRLKQTDYDNSSTTSEIIKVDCGTNSSNEKELLVYPNPAERGDEIFIEVKGFDNETEILVVVLDIYGRMQYSKVVLTETSSSTVIANDRLNRLLPGTYIIVGTSDDKIYRKKLVINK